MLKTLSVALAAIFISFVLTLTLSVQMAFAHVTVKPGQVGVGAFQTFTVSVPSEEDLPTTSIRLVLPDGLNEVTPTVKIGWQINVKENEIVWSGGTIPAHQRDEFSFSVQVPASPTELHWKAYQTYQDGTVVAWDQDPEKATEVPYSVTKVVNDLRPSPSTNSTNNTSSSAPLLLSLASLALSVVSLTVARKK